MSDVVEESKAVEPDWWVLARNETEDWQLDPKHMALVDRILTVYLFDRCRHVHCCELSPSYELWPLGYQVIFKQSLEVSEADREAVEDVVRRCEADLEVRYRHVAAVERAMRRAGVSELYQEPKPTWQLFRTSADATDQFAHYGQTGVPLVETDDDREKAVDQQRDTVIGEYRKQEVF